MRRVPRAFEINRDNCSYFDFETFPRPVVVVADSRAVKISDPRMVSE